MSRIMECRKSGLSDSRWCLENDIAPSSLYYWIKKLRMEAPVIPAPNQEMAIPFKQDVVPLRVTREVQIPDTNNGVATAKHPEQWSGGIRDWSLPECVSKSYE